MLRSAGCPRWVHHLQRSTCSVPRSSCTGVAAAAAQAGAALALATRAVLCCGIQGRLCQCDAPGGAFAPHC